MGKRRSRNISRWVKRHQNKHLCQCGCGEYIVVKRQHAKPSVSIPKFIKGHNLQLPEEEPVVVPPKESNWDKLSPEEQQRRISQLKSFGSGEDNPAWKGGRRYDENGYIQIRMQNHPFAKDGYMYEHRLIVEARTRKYDPSNPSLVEFEGRKYLGPVCIVHHIDEVKDNNNEENLMLLPNQAAHAFIHKSPLPMEERLRRIELGIFHSGPIDEER